MFVDVVIVGAGHNGLVSAAALAGAGLRTLVLEASDRVGGCAITSELAPGFRCSTLTHRAGLDPAIVSTLGLERHGLRIVRPEVLACAPTLDGRALTLWADPAKAAASLAAISPRDAEAYPKFLASVAAVSRTVRTLLLAPAPEIDQPSSSDLIGFLKTLRAFRSLDRADAYRLLRWLPMPVADFVGEWFESEPLSATVAAAGLLGAFAGPRSAGTTAALLWLAASDGQPIAPGWTVLGGMGALADALAAAARRAGAEIRTGARVARITVRDGTATGVVLESGDEIGAPVVMSNADPRRTLLGLVDPAHLGPEFARRVRNIRMRGVTAKVNYALSALPSFTALRTSSEESARASLGGAVRLASDLSAIERAFDAVKYGGFAEDLWVEVTFPSIADPDLAPKGAHVASAYVQFTPAELRGTSWDGERQRLGNLVTRAIAAHAPDFQETIVARQVLTPFDLEDTFGLTGGHIFHGELALDQLLLARPTLGWARYRTPIKGLYLCGVGAHPGAGLDGRSGWAAAKEVLRATGRRQALRL
jgi:phytoene dehydrogenase-like protein